MNFGLFKISIKRNEYVFAKLDWLLYKLFRKRRKIPCGRTKKDKYLCCCLTPNDKNSEIVDSGHKIICKVCGNLHVLSSEIMTDINRGAWREF